MERSMKYLGKMKMVFKEIPEKIHIKVEYTDASKCKKLDIRSK
jgi:hypothetical protein